MSKEICSTCGNEKIIYYTEQCFRCDKPTVKTREYVELIPACYYASIKNGLPPDTIMDAIDDYQRKTHNRFYHSNDSYCDLPMPDDAYEQDDDGHFEKIVPYLQMLHNEYPLNSTTFFVSW